MDDSAKLALVAIATSQALSVDEAWALVDEVTADVTEPREASRRVHAAAQRASWGDHDVRSIN